MNDQFEIFAKMNEKLMQRGMFLTFWLRTKNDYFNVKSELTKTSVFQREIKTEFIQDKHELISGGFPKSFLRINFSDDVVFWQYTLVSDIIVY